MDQGASIVVKRLLAGSNGSTLSDIRRVKVDAWMDRRVVAVRKAELDLIFLKGAWWNKAKRRVAGRQKE